MTQENLARVRQPDPALRAIDELGAERHFELLDLLGKGRLGDVQHLRRAREAAVLPNSDQVPQAEWEQLTSIHSPSLSSP